MRLSVQDPPGMDAQLQMDSDECEWIHLRLRMQPRIGSNGRRWVHADRPAPGQDVWLWPGFVICQVAGR